jgi:hypothetical protein
MIRNLNDEGVARKVDEEIGRHPAVKTFFDHAKSLDNCYDIDPLASGLEVVPCNKVDNETNRARMKVFLPDDEHLLIWFYKPSLSPHSRDRFSYGGVMMELGSLDMKAVGTEIDGCLNWLDSGLNPELRPMNWEGSFTFDIPV